MATTPDAPVRRTPSPGRRWAWRIAALLLTVLVLEVTSVRLLVGARQSWEAIGSADPWLLLLGLALEVGSYLCFSGLTRTLLPPGAPRYPTVLAIDVTGNGSSHVLPGGGASAAVLRYRLLGRYGVASQDAASAAALETAVTVLWLIAALALGLVVAVPHPGTHPFLKTACVLAVVLLTAIGGLVAVLMARPDEVVVVTQRIAAHVPLLRAEALEHGVRTIIELLRTIGQSREARGRALAWGLGNWVCDAASLWVCLAAFGTLVNPGGLITTYAVVSLMAMLPITPGGLGIVEGVAVPMLASFGTPHQVALLGVLAWRLFGFWLPIPVAAVSYSGLRFSSRAGGRPGSRPR